MELDSYGQVGLMGLHTLRNAQFNQDINSFTTSPSRAKGVHYGGMHTYSGSGPQSKVPWLSCPSVGFLTHFPGHKRNRLLY